MVHETRIFISEYESEERLREPDSFSLPAPLFASRPHQVLMKGIDGLTIAMAKDGDTLITRTPLSPVYQNYWNKEIAAVNYRSPGVNSDETESIYERLRKDKDSHELLKQGHMEHYALVPEFYDLCQALEIPVSAPPLSLIQKLNGKSWSNELKWKYDLPARGIHVSSVAEYEEAARTMLAENGRVLIKDSMGVSGKGILLIDSPKMAERLAVHFRRQEEKGRRQFDFVLEPCLDRKTDFSCQFQIERSGKLVINGYQKNRSKGYAYLGSMPLGEAEYELLQKAGYPEVITWIADEMASLGYYGYACIDSMITAEDQVIPLLEINPRMSMARFNLVLGEKLHTQCSLGYTEGVSHGECSVSDVLTELEEAGILYTKARGCGLIPLAPNTWALPECEGTKVRIYFVIAYDNKDDYETILDSWLGYCARRICTGAVR